MRCDTRIIDILTLFGISFRIFRENMKLLVSVVVLLSLPYYIWLALGGLEDAGWFTSNGISGGDESVVLDVLYTILFVITAIPLIFLPPAVVFSVAEIYSDRSIGIRDVLMFCVKRWKVLTQTILLVFPIYLVVTALLFVFIMALYDMTWNMNTGWNVLAILAGSGVLLTGSVWLAFVFSLSFGWSLLRMLAESRHLVEVLPS